MADTGQVESDLLFISLTRPTFIFGVTYMPVVANFFGCMMYYVLTTDFKGFLLMPVIHLIFYGMTKKEPLFMELFMTRAQHFNRCKNRFFHGMTNSYSVM